MSQSPSEFDRTQTRNKEWWRQQSHFWAPFKDETSNWKSKLAGKYGTKKRKERREEPLGTMSYQTSSKRSPPFCLLIDWAVKHKFSGTNQKPGRRRPFGTVLVRHCPQGLFSPFFSFLRTLFFRPFRLSLAPTICPWVSEDGLNLIGVLYFTCQNGPKSE